MIRHAHDILGHSGIVCLLHHQIRRIHPAGYANGHSHVNQCIELDGPSYLNNTLATPEETRIVRKELLCVFDTEAVPSCLAGGNRREFA